MEVFRQLHLVLGLGDGAQHRAGREELLVHAKLLEAVLHHPDGVVGVVDGEGGGEAQPLNIPAQDAHTGGVEGGGPDVQGLGAQYPLQAVFQLSGGLVGKGDGQDGPGGRRVQLTQPGSVLPPLLGGVVHIATQEVQILFRGPVRHLGGVRAPSIADEVGHPVDEHRGLARASPRQQQQRALGGEHGLELLRV